MINLILSFLLPLIWIFYFLKKDKHPEPILWLFFAFILGIVAAFLSYLVEDIAHSFNLNKSALFILSAFVEEFFKFLVVWSLIFPHRVFDEPVDAMVYMMVSALGFSSIENFLYLQKNNEFLLIFGRFLGANFLHILASGLIGYGYGYLWKTKRILPFVVSFLGATALHFLYNFVIISKVIGFILILPVLWSIFLLVLSELEYLAFYDERKSTRRET